MDNKHGIYGVSIVELHIVYISKRCLYDYLWIGITRMMLRITIVGRINNAKY